MNLATRNKNYVHSIYQDCAARMIWKFDILPYTVYILFILHQNIFHMHRLIASTGKNTKLFCRTIFANSSETDIKMWILSHLSISLGALSEGIQGAGMREPKLSLRGVLLMVETRRSCSGVCRCVPPHYDCRVYECSGQCESSEPPVWGTSLPVCLSAPSTAPVQAQ